MSETSVDPTIWDFQQDVSQAECLNGIQHAIESRWFNSDLDFTILTHKELGHLQIIIKENKGDSYGII